MPRRPDPVRIAAAWEAGTRARLRDELRLLPARLDELLESWAIEAGIRDINPRSHAYWDGAYTWVTEHAVRR